MTNPDYKEMLIKHREKIKFLIDKLQEIERGHDELKTHIKIIDNKNFEKFNDDIHKLDMRIQAIEIAHGRYDEKWRSIINFVVQIIWVTMAAYILFKLGLQPPL